MQDGTPHSASAGDRAAVVTRERVTLSPRGCGATMGHARPESTCNTMLYDPGAPAPQLHIGTQLRCCDPRGATSYGSPMPSRGANRETGWVGRPTWPVLVLCLQAEEQRASDPLAHPTKSDLPRNHV